MLTVRELPRQPANDDSYWLSPAVVLLAADDGSARLIDLDSAFYALSRTAAEMLQGVLAHGIDATIVHLAERYGVSPERIRSDIEMLLDNLLKQDLIERSGARSWRRHLKRRSAHAVIGPMLRLLGLFPAPERLTVAMLLVLARSCTAMFGWGPTVEAWRAVIRPKASLSPPSQGDVIQRIDDQIRRMAAKVPSVDCKERALSCWYLLCSLGIPATLIVGVQLYPLAGHSWCQVGDRILTDHARRCEAFVPIIRYEGVAAALAH